MVSAFSAPQARARRVAAFVAARFRAAVDDVQPALHARADAGAIATPSLEDSIGVESMMIFRRGEGGDLAGDAAKRAVLRSRRVRGHR